MLKRDSTSARVRKGQPQRVWLEQFSQPKDVDECADTSDNRGVSSLIENLHLQKRQDKVAPSHFVTLSLSPSRLPSLSQLPQPKLLASDSCQIDVAREPKRNRILRHFEL